MLLLALGACATMPATPLQPRGDAAQALAGAGTFKRYLALAEAAGMVPALQANGPITVFAPTDAAFARMPRGTLRRFTRPGNRAELKALVANHIVAGAVSPAALAKGSRQLRTMAGRPVELNGEHPGKGVFYGRAKVTGPSLGATNGAVHAIDRVVLP